MLFCETFCCHLVCYKNMHTHTHTDTHSRTHAVGAQNWDVVLCLGWVIKSCSIIRACFFLFLCLFFSLLNVCSSEKVFLCIFYLPRSPFPFPAPHRTTLWQIFKCVASFCSVCLANTKSCINDTTPRRGSTPLQRGKEKNFPLLSSKKY